MRRQSIKKPISEVKITNPYPVGSVKYKSADIDEFGNRIIYKTSGFQRLVIILLILIFLAICAS